jgi:hypothetical protein
MYIHVFNTRCVLRAASYPSAHTDIHIYVLTCIQLQVRAEYRRVLRREASKSLLARHTMAHEREKEELRYGDESARMSPITSADSSDGAAAMAREEERLLAAYRRQIEATKNKQKDEIEMMLQREFLAKMYERSAKDKVLVGFQDPLYARA